MKIKYVSFFVIKKKNLFIHALFRNIEHKKNPNKFSRFSCSFFSNYKFPLFCATKKKRKSEKKNSFIEIECGEENAEVCGIEKKQDE
jgi:hypothetical protein